MINRILIRIKVLQIFHAYCQKGSVDLVAAEKDLNRSLLKTFDLYHYLLFLICVITDAERKRIDAQQNKWILSDTDRNPNRRLADNRLAEQLRTNESLEKFINLKGAFWTTDYDVFIRDLLTAIRTSDLYNEYLEQPDSYENDREFWRKAFKHIVLTDERLSEILEENEIYWADTLESIDTFLIKTIKRLAPGPDRTQPLAPMFRDEEDRRFAISLLHRAILENAENKELIDKHIQNWDLERLATIDRHIMQIALAEIRNFPLIPINVSLNEYIDLARYYSTPKSSLFINGILDGIVTELKENGKLLKN